MTCPICDQKPMNCDCTAEEKRLYSETEDLEAEIERLKLTDAEREALNWCLSLPMLDRDAVRMEPLRGLLERLG